MDEVPGNGVLFDRRADPFQLSNIAETRAPRRHVLGYETGAPVRLHMIDWVNLAIGTN